MKSSSYLDTKENKNRNYLKYFDVETIHYGVNKVDEIRNKILQQTTKTKYKIGDIVFLEKEKVRIVEVQPKGFITRSESKSYYSSEMLPPVKCGKNIYQYVRLSDNGEGQTTEDQLSIDGLYPVRKEPTNLIELIQNAEDTCPFNLNINDHIHNIILQKNTKTKYKVGDIVFLEKEKVRIVEIQPKGFISFSEGKNYIQGGKTPPVITNKTIYVYQRLSDKCKGQTDEDSFTNKQ